MIAKLKELRKDETGFTLVELMVVVLIIGILAAIAIPVFLNLQKEGIKASVKSDVKNTVTNVAVALASNGGDLATALTNAEIVNSDPTNTTITVAEDAATTEAGDYTVVGSNEAAGESGAPFTYTFTSATGQYS